MFLKREKSRLLTIHDTVHDAQEILPLLKRKWNNLWPGFKSCSKMYNRGAREHKRATGG